MIGDGNSVSAVSRAGGDGGTVFSSRSSGGTSRMSTGMALDEAFVLTLRLTLRPVTGVEGRVAIGPYQGAPQGGGYRLVILTGAGTSGPGFALERQDAGGGTETLAAYDGPLRIEDGRARQLRWTRDGDGEMTISIDGAEILSARDRSLAGGFDGLVLVNSGGAVQVGAIGIDGTQ